jgi:hypothetical protein
MVGIARGDKPGPHLASQGRQHDAYTMLADIYSRFTVVFDSADLKAAKALLERLRT